MHNQYESAIYSLAPPGTHISSRYHQVHIHIKIYPTRYTYPPKLKCLMTNKSKYKTDWICTRLAFTFAQSSDLVNIWFSQEGREDSLSICKVVKHCPFVCSIHPLSESIQHAYLLFSANVKHALDDMILVVTLVLISPLCCWLSLFLRSGDDVLSWEVKEKSRYGWE